MAHMKFRIVGWSRCPHCNSDRVFSQEQTVWVNVNNADEVIHTDSNHLPWMCFDCLRDIKNPDSTNNQEGDK